MKKIYLFATAMVFGSMAFGQQTQSMLDKDMLFNAKEIKSDVQDINSKALGVTFHIDSFNNAADWTMDNQGSTSADFGWSIDAVIDGWWSSIGLLSTSGGNFAELSNGDAQAGTQMSNVVYTMTSANPISLSGYGNEVTLSFEQYGARFNDIQEILISEDGTTFTPIGDNSGFTVLSTTGGDSYPNPNVKEINLAPYVSASATQVWVQFYWTTAFPSSTDPGAWITYGWYIDDLMLTSNPGNDIQVIDDAANTAGLFYYQVPVSQIQPVDFTAVVTKGANNVTNGTYTVTMNPGAVTGVSPVFNLTNNIFDTVTASVTPPGLGSYSVTSAFAMDSVDDNPGNNVIDQVDFDVTNFIYARDNGTATGTTGNGGVGYELGNLFDIWSDVQCWGLNVRLGTGSPLGELFQVRLYQIDNTTGDFLYVEEGPLIEVDNSMINQEKIYKFNFPVTLLAGTTYLPVVVNADGGVRIARAGTSDPQTTFIYDNGDADWFYTTSTPWVRLNLDPSLSVDEKAGSIATSAVYPNPTTGNSELSFTLSNAQDVSVTVFDVDGKEISSIALGNKVAGVHAIDINSASFQAGVYFVNIVSNDGVATKKLIKK